jgi:phosphatidate cytidylyltransferase
MKRLLTAAVGVPLALAAMFLLPPWGFFAHCAFLFGWVALEFAALARCWAPGAPLFLMPPLTLGAAAALTAPQALANALVSNTGTLSAAFLPIAVLAMSLGMSCLALLGRTPVRESLPALGAFSFGIPYVALPIAALSHLQRRDPWLLFLLVAIVWLGDSAAYYVGGRFGKHKMAPVVSPNKSWEGAIASQLVSALATAVWSYFYLGRIDLAVVTLGLVVNFAAQLGDLVESMLKRGAGIKDSGNVLPGHGGMLDRADALLFAAPVLWLGLWWLGPAVFQP